MKCAFRMASTIMLAVACVVTSPMASQQPQGASKVASVFVTTYPNDMDGMKHEIVSKSFKNLQTYIDKSSGVLTVSFTYVDPEIPVPLCNRFLIGLYDANGQYLTHISTKEWFYGERFKKQFGGDSGALFNVYPNGVLLPTGAFMMRYAVNQRDAAYVKTIKIAIGQNPG